MEHFELVSQYASHRRPAPGHRQAGEGLSGRQPVPDPSRRYWFWKNIYHGQHHSGAEQAYPGAGPQ